MNHILGLIGKNYNLIVLLVILSVLYLGMFTKILTTAFRIISKPCESVFGSPYSKAKQKFTCVRIRQCTSFRLDSLSISFVIFAIFIRPPVALLFTAVT